MAFSREHCKYEGEMRIGWTAIRCGWGGFFLAAACGLAPGSPVRLTVFDSTANAPVACRIHLKDAAGKPVQPKGLPFWNDHFVCAGAADLQLAAGDYTYELDRGPEYFVTSEKLAVAEAESRNVTN